VAPSPDENSCGQDAHRHRQPCHTASLPTCDQRCEIRRYARSAGPQRARVQACRWSEIFGCPEATLPSSEFGLLTTPTYPGGRGNQSPAWAGAGYLSGMLGASQANGEGLGLLFVPLAVSNGCRWPDEPQLLAAEFVGLGGGCLGDRSSARCGAPRLTPTLGGAGPNRVMYQDQEVCDVKA